VILFVWLADCSSGKLNTELAVTACY